MPFTEEVVGKKKLKEYFSLRFLSLSALLHVSLFITAKEFYLAVIRSFKSCQRALWICPEIFKTLYK